MVPRQHINLAIGISVLRNCTENWCLRSVSRPMITIESIPGLTIHQAITTEQISNNERAMQGLSISTQRLALEIDDAKTKVQLAEKKHKDAVEYQKYREDQLNSAMA